MTAPTSHGQIGAPPLGRLLACGSTAAVAARGRGGGRRGRPAAGGGRAAAAGTGRGQRERHLALHGVPVVGDDAVADLVDAGRAERRHRRADLPARRRDRAGLVVRAVRADHGDRRELGRDVFVEGERDRLRGGVDARLVGGVAALQPGVGERRGGAEQQRDAGRRRWRRAAAARRGSSAGARCARAPVVPVAGARRGGRAAGAQHGAPPTPRPSAPTSRPAPASQRAVSSVPSASAAAWAVVLGGPGGVVPPPCPSPAAGGQGERRCGPLGLGSVGVHRLVPGDDLAVVVGLHGGQCDLLDAGGQRADATAGTRGTRRGRCACRGSRSR